MIDDTGLNQKRKEQKITRTDLRSLIGLSPRIIAKIGKWKALSVKSLRQIVDYLGCDPAPLCREGSDNPILQTLRAEKEGGISGGLYHELQVRMAYHSDHMEGSRSAEEQTRLIFETNTVPAGDGVPVDDILETVHHFRAIDFMQGRKACGAQGMPSLQDLFLSHRGQQKGSIFSRHCRLAPGKGVADRCLPRGTEYLPSSDGRAGCSRFLSKNRVMQSAAAAKKRQKTELVLRLLSFRFRCVFLPSGDLTLLFISG